MAFQTHAPAARMPAVAPAAPAPMAGPTSAPGPRPTLARDTSVYDRPSQPFPLHTGGNERLESLIRAMTRSMHLQPTPLSDAFFSSRNLDAVQRDLADLIKRRTGYAIDRQSDDGLLAVMRYVYIREAQNITSDVGREVRRLNAAVIAEAAPSVASGLAQYLAYIRDASQLPDPLPRGEQTSIKGSKTSDLFRPL